MMRTADLYHMWSRDTRQELYLPFVRGLCHATLPRCDNTLTPDVSALPSRASLPDLYRCQDTVQSLPR